GAVFLEMLYGTAHGRRNRVGDGSVLLPSPFSPIEPPLFRDLLEQRFVGEVSRPGDYTIAREVGPPVQLLQVVGREGADRLPRAENLETVGVLRPQRLVGEIEDLIVGGVEDGADLLEHD